MTIKNIAVVGLGAMGNPLATRLMKAGYSVAGYDIVEEKISSLIPLGLKPAKSPTRPTRTSCASGSRSRKWRQAGSVTRGP